MFWFRFRFRLANVKRIANCERFVDVANPNGVEGKLPVALLRIAVPAPVVPKQARKPLPKRGIVFLGVPLKIATFEFDLFANVGKTRIP